MLTTLNQSNLLNAKPSRLIFIDGLRGIAILLVVFYHAFSYRWASYLPYGNAYNDIKLFHFGDYGVKLFFMISGFVITMTLEKCANFWDFMFKRWLRLFPAMLIASIVILATAPLLTARPYGPPALIDIIPGITFIEPEFYRSVFGYYQTILEGSFWSLFVEMKFYIVAGLLYFSFGTKKMIAIITMMFLITLIFEFTSPLLPKNLASQLNLFLKYLNWGYYGWFAAGALFHQYYTTKNWHYWIAAVFIALLAARCLGGFATVSMVVATMIVLLMALAMVNKTLQKILSARWLILIGFVSYPLYLLHENAMISMINQLYSTGYSIPAYLLSIIALLPIFFIAWIISKFAEPLLRRSILASIAKLNN